MVEEQKQEEENMMTKAEALVERQEKIYAANLDTLKKMEEIEARRILGGKSAFEVQQPPKVETPQEYAKRILGGGK